MQRILKLVLLIAIVAGRVFAQQHPNLARGFDPEKLYQFGEIDNVNVFNGNLIITIPIGPKYPVSSTLSYGLTLVYNGNPWNHYPETESIPSRFANAGLGWQLTMGELVGPNDSLATWHGTRGSWVYASPDGAERVFYPYLHKEEIGTGYEAGVAKPENEGRNPIVGYTRDGSYLRLVRLPPRNTATLSTGSETVKLWRARYRVEFPDGTMHTFESTEEMETASSGEPTYEQELNLRFQLVRIDDRFGNYVQVNYVASILDPAIITWEIKEFRANGNGTHTPGRVQRVLTRNETFRPFVSGAQSRYMIQEVNLTSFGGSTARYEFRYDKDVTISAPCATWPSRYDADGKPISRATKTTYLRSVILPDGSSFGMPEYQPPSYYPEDANVVNCSPFSGHILELTLPTGGSIAYEPGIRRFPGTREEQGGVNGTIGPATQLSMGVGLRTFRDENGTAVASWKYDSRLRSLATYTTGGPAGTASVARESVVTVTETDHSPYHTPVKSRTTAYYFNVWKGGADFPYTAGGNVCYPGATNREYGRPFTRSYGTNVGEFLLSSETFDGACLGWDDGPQASNGCYSRGRCRTTPPDVAAQYAVPLRRNYVVYESDTFQQPAVESGRETDQNLRLRGSRTGFLESPGGDLEVIEDAFTQVLHSNFDGLGHYRTETRTHNFEETPSTRTVTTRYNANGSTTGTYVPDANVAPAEYMISPSAPWLLNLYDRVTTTQTAGTSATAGTAIEEFCFDRSNGFLQRKRTFAGASAAQNDLLVTFEHVAGNVTAENYYGGDVQQLPASFDTCGGVRDTTGRDYRIVHGYSAGVRNSSGHDGAGFKSLDLDIDFSTGLVAQSRDAAGVLTTYRYDKLGRITEQRPHDEAWTQLTYNTTARPVRVNVKRNTLGNTTLTENWFYFDGLGRLSMTKERMPDGPPLTTDGPPTRQWSTRRTLYDGFGRKLHATVPFYRTTSDWESAPSAHATSFIYDAFGRQERVTAPDGKGTRFAYKGTRQTTRTVSIAIGPTDSDPAIEQDVDTIEKYDGYGRLISVSEGSGANGAMVETKYVYDVGNRLVKATTSDASVTQERRFTYDNRGFLLSERHPEKGALGNGSVEFSGYDARGNATRKIDGTAVGRFDLTFEYDAAERLRFVRDIGSDGARRVLKEFTYATDSNPSGATTAGDLAKGKLRTATRHNHDDVLGSVEVKETYYYTGRAGRVGQRDTVVSSTDAFKGASFSYSQSYDELGNIEWISYPTTSALPSPRTVFYSYTNGLLTNVSGFANITYQPNGLVADVAHTGGMIETWERDPRGMSRPLSIRVTAPGGVNWTYGEFAYDGAGNLMQIGARTYRYDKVGRLVQEQLVLPYQPIGANQTIRYSYDAFGNRTHRSWTSVTGDAFSRGSEPSGVVSATNHLSGDTLYDDAGNVTATAGTAFTYDGAGMMTAQKPPSSSVEVHYLYTADDERVAVVQHNHVVLSGRWNRTTWTVIPLCVWRAG